ncbi:cation diffusion facilitator family transporter [Halorhabdus utahensis DSM 12940]|uniref:Cation diffusion facilitator family transporter n=1 Tax=Halorhabdus utahensis (strain DSM 12940 / JCM 11049 / AX-2) TaxID=519442 RepID=C7NNN7_HALUD|nr:cation diffusion facilitator family transporter [Halorhabdus utahensis]ACV10265.1 cation diffusion facilitator family transporter [Halorhabdus utahensis DSM 12940]
MTRRRTLRRVGLLLFGANLALFVAKGVVAVETGSLAVQSEAINSLADTVYSLVIVGGLYLTTRPPDFEHPHGHERIEPFVSLFVAAGIFLAGGAVIYQSGTALLAGDIESLRSPAAIGVLVVSIGAKLALYRYCLAVGRTWQSPALVATALDNRNDVLTAGAALAGVIGAAVGAPILDPLAALVVAIGILHTGVEVVRDNVNYLVGAAPPDELRKEILRTALDHPDVKGAHDVIAHYVGPEIDVSLHVEVEGHRTLREAHDIESAVVQSVEELQQVDDAFVHVDPKELGEWKTDEAVDQLVETTEETTDRADDGR